MISFSSSKADETTAASWQLAHRAIVLMTIFQPLMMFIARASTICRSDATINRNGVRMGTSEIYRVVEALPEILDSMVVDLEYLGRDSFLGLFLVLKPGQVLDDALHHRVSHAISTHLSPRFLPNEIRVVPDIPRTLTGKKQEVPIKKMLLGQQLASAINRDAMANPACLDWYARFAAEYLAQPPKPDSSHGA